MLIFFPKKNKHKEGEIIFAFPEAFSNLNLSFSVKEDGKTVLTNKDFGHSYLMPLDAQDFEDPEKPDDNVHDYKISFDAKGSPKHIHHKQDTKKIIQIVSEKDILFNIEGWDENYQALKGLYPNLKIRNAMKKENMLE